MLLTKHIKMVRCRLNNGLLGEREKLLIQEDISAARKRSAELLLRLESKDDEKEIGIELLHTWIIDLLGKMALSLSFEQFSLFY